MQEQFIKHIRNQIPEERSLIDHVSSILNISYDAAYRRVNSKTSISLEEAVILSKHYKISLNKLYEVGEQHTLLVEKSPTIATINDLENYFKVSLASIEPLIRLKSASITYSAKDIPIFYTLTNTYITKYKFYVWLKFLNEDGSMAKTTFEEFLEQIPDSLIESAVALADRYNYIDITEFWNDNTINGTLQQILYYFETGLLSTRMALLICEDLQDIVTHVEQQTINQTILNSKNNASYNLFKSDLLTMSNTVMIKTQYQKLFFTPFTVLKYFKIQHPGTCEEMDLFFAKQKKSAKQLVSAGEKDRSQFFNIMRQKIKSVVTRINMNNDAFYL